VIASIVFVLESLMKCQCEISRANNILLKFQKDMIPVGNKYQTNKFFYPVLIAESVRKRAVKKGATKVDADTIVLI
jgi:hypothetical protein